MEVTPIGGSAAVGGSGEIGGEIAEGVTGGAASGSGSPVGPAMGGWLPAWWGAQARAKIGHSTTTQIFRGCPAATAILSATTSDRVGFPPARCESTEVGLRGGRGRTRTVIGRCHQRTDPWPPQCPPTPGDASRSLSVAEIEQTAEPRSTLDAAARPVVVVCRCRWTDELTNAAVYSEAVAQF